MIPTNIMLNVLEKFNKVSHLKKNNNMKLGVGETTIKVWQRNV